MYTCIAVVLFTVDSGGTLIIGYAYVYITNLKNVGEVSEVKYVVEFDSSRQECHCNLWCNKPFTYMYVTSM